MAKHYDWWTTCVAVTKGKMFWPSVAGHFNWLTHHPWGGHALPISACSLHVLHFSACSLHISVTSNSHLIGQKNSEPIWTPSGWAKFTLWVESTACFFFFCCHTQFTKILTKFVKAGPRARQGRSSCKTHGLHQDGTWVLACFVVHALCISSALCMHSA